MTAQFKGVMSRCSSEAQRRSRSVLLSTTVRKVFLGSRLFSRRQKTDGGKCGGVGVNALILSARGLRLNGTGMGLHFRRNVISPTCGACHVRSYSVRLVSR